jgi:multiple sugar transport system substrate-binding protein
MSRAQITRRRVLQMMGLTAMTPLLAACGQAAAPAQAPAPTAKPADGTAKPAAQPAAPAAQPAAAPQKPQAPAVAKSGEEVVVRALMSVGGSGKAFQGGLDDFNQEHKGTYRVEVEMIAFEALREKQMTQFISGTPANDVLSVNSDWLSGMAHFMEPLDPYVERDKLDLKEMFGSDGAKSTTFDGTLAGLLVRTGGDVYWYNREMFGQLGLKPPTTLDELRKNAEALGKQTPSGGEPVYGYSIMAQSPLWTVSSFADLYYPHGGHYLTADLKEANPTLLEPFTVDILTFMRGLAADGLTPNPLSWTYDDNIVAFQQARLGSSAEGWMRANLVEDPQKSKVVGKIGYDVMPTQKLGSDDPKYYGAGGWAFCIDKNSTKKDAAWALVKHMVSFDVQKMMAIEYANGPTLIKVLEDAEFQKQVPAASAYAKGLKTIGMRPHFPVVQQPELEKVTHEHIQAFLAGTKDAKTTATELHRRIGEVLRS